MKEFALLAISLRATERVPTKQGARLDHIRAFEKSAGHLWDNISKITTLKCCDVGPARFTAVMCGAMRSMFSEVFLVRSDNSRTIAINTDGCIGNFVTDHVIACRSDKSDAGQVEGDDFVYVVFLERTADTKSATVLRLDERLRSAADVWIFLKGIGVLERGVEPPPTGDIIPGFYLITSERIQEKKAVEFETWKVPEWLDGSLGDALFARRQAVSTVCAYLYYCGLICQRTERLAMSINVNGDWDDEWRKLILARKKLVTGRKYAFIKNRAQPSSPILPVFWGTSLVYRLEEQILNLTELVDALSHTLETQNSYVSSLRLRTIEMIIFISTVLGLGLTINTIQMPPFYDSSTSNALARPVFWQVPILVALFALVGTWGFIRARVLIKRISRTSTPRRES